jgi:diaminopimelate decarboxylase
VQPTDQPAILSLFPEGTSLVNGEIAISGVPASDLAAAYGTPAYIVDEVALRQRIRHYRDGLSLRWPNSRVYFASKAFPSTAVYRVMSEEGLGIDVAGGGELVMALAGGADPRDILVHGNAKTDGDLKMVLDAGVGLVIVDNLHEVHQLSALVTGTQDVLVRIRPNVDTATHEAMATGHGASKFGMGPEEARQAIEIIQRSPTLRMRGLHVHIGSQVFELGAFSDSVKALSEFGEFDIYNLGGGLGERHTYTDPDVSVDDYLDAVVHAAKNHLPGKSRLLLEPGRSLVARAGVTLYRVVNVKRGGKTLVAVDGGMADNLEVSLYGQRFEATLADRFHADELVSIVGRHCESGDELIDGVHLDAPSAGDLLLMPVTGAYCFTMANNYNGSLRLPVVFVSAGVPRLVVRRETYEDLLARDILVPPLHPTPPLSVSG